MTHSINCNRLKTIIHTIYIFFLITELYSKYSTTIDILFLVLYYCNIHLSRLLLAPLNDQLHQKPNP